MHLIFLLKFLHGKELLLSSKGDYNVNLQYIFDIM